MLRIPALSSQAGYSWIYDLRFTRGEKFEVKFTTIDVKLRLDDAAFSLSAKLFHSEIIKSYHWATSHQNLVCHFTPFLTNLSIFEQKRG